MDQTIAIFPGNGSSNARVGLSILIVILTLLQLIRFKFSKYYFEKIILIALVLFTVTLWLFI